MTKTESSAVPVSARPGTVTNLRWADKTHYGDSYRRDLFEQYRIIVEMADNHSTRRSQANEFFLLACTAVLSVTGVFSGLATGVGVQISAIIVAMLSAVGLVFSIVWFFTLRTYRALNSAKYKLILEIEQSLPVNPYETEWQMVGASDRTPRAGIWSRHRQLTSLESFVPVLFGVLFLALAIWSGRTILPGT